MRRSQGARNELRWAWCILALSLGCAGPERSPAAGAARSKSTVSYATGDSSAAQRARPRVLASHGGHVPPLAAMALRATAAAAPPPRTYASVASSPAAPGTSPIFSAPELLGPLVGPGSRQAPGLRLYGTDLGLSFSHRGKLFMLFGDTWDAAHSICTQGEPQQDDTVATLPLERGAGIPQLQFVTRADRPSLASRIQVYRGGQPLKLAYGQAPMAGFSDGTRSFALFERLTPAKCADASLHSGSASCMPGSSSYCSTDLGLCQPDYLSFPVPCRLGQEDGCLPGQTCVATSLCIDPTSSQYDDGFGGQAAAVTYETELAVANDASPSDYTSILTWHTNKFSHPAARTVQKLTGAREGNDYRPGHDAVLIWGRPGFLAEHGRQAALYLMHHRLPLPAAGTLSFEPRYFAGLSADGQPQWSNKESDAKPLALDGGQHGGDGFEEQGVLGPYTVSYLPAPIGKWIMLYGGDLADYLMQDHAASRGGHAPGAIVARVADQPWGPWSKPITHLMPGDPARAGTPYGPGGYLHHPECLDTEEGRCSRSDVHRPLDTVLDGCPLQLPDPGRLYAPNVIDEYTQPTADGGLDMFWNVSTWNPYGVLLFKTHITPGSVPAPKDELSDKKGLTRLSDLRSLPELPAAHGRYVQQSSYDRGTRDTAFPLSDRGNRDFNNFVCASADAVLPNEQFAPFKLDLPSCPESYVHGAVLGRFEGAGRMVRMWLGMQSLIFDRADEEVLRIYVDDDPVPRVDVLLRDALDGSAGDVFAPPFGAGSPRRMAWYYPVAFQRKLIVALDKLGEYDNYFYHCDVALDTETQPVAHGGERLREREGAQRLLATTYPPVPGKALLPLQRIELAAGGSHTLELAGPATLYELRLRHARADSAALSRVKLRVHWDGAAQPAIELPLLELFAASPVPPELSNQVLVSYVDGPDQVLALKLPAPFASQAKLSFENPGRTRAAFELRLTGTKGPLGQVGRLHAQRRETRGPTSQREHVAIEASGRGRLVGVCGNWQGHADPNGGIQSDALNLLEGDVLASVDGQPALVGTGTEEYTDDVFYFTDAPHARAFEQAWGVYADPETSRGHASFCRWHVLGTELDFSRSLQLGFELGGAGNPGLVDRVHTVAYWYQ